ncbi:MAG TPA: ArsR family transcriptional regulator [Candidatus Caldiarchaeum subterraneum]|uniref:ArsR family transcriptional regulator n=1 Tax=Caldiarchaeum subterraneum TaxID=311458 RepID=A0A833ED53_CALS0|nr:ArsR family transcriptional regulator [Candidatus Caldarchaeum subterraneum]
MRRTATVKQDNKQISSIIADNPELFKLVSTRTAYRILCAIAEGVGYPAEIARRLSLSKQLVYYYIKRFERNELVSLVGESNVRGGHAQFYRVNTDAVTLVVNRHGWRRASRDMPRRLADFLNPIFKNGRLDGIVVVGSPHPHGPNMSVASDGHYAFQLGLFLGQYVESVDGFKIRLDVDVKAEKLYDNNMILIGGPGVNLITAEVNDLLPIRFNERNYWSGIVSENQIYTSEFTGLVAKVKMNNGKHALVLAGLRAVGTKATVMMLTTRWRELLKRYNPSSERWAAVVLGLDLDGDGKIDSARLLEST